MGDQREKLKYHLDRDEVELHSNGKEEDNFLEEFASEVVPGVQYFDQARTTTRPGFVYGLVAIFFALLSLYLIPLITGIIGLFFAYKAVTKGAKVLGYTAMGFALFSIILYLYLMI